MPADDRPNDSDLSDSAHPTRHVQYEDLAANIDEELSDLVLEIWRAGIRTLSSCQDAGESIGTDPHATDWLREIGTREAGRAYIDFLTVEDACLFHAAVANGGPRNALYERMVHWASPGAWASSLHLDDVTLDEDEPDWGRPSAFLDGPVHVSFPRSDIAEIQRRLCRYNANELGPHDEPTWETVTVEVGDDEEVSGSRDEGLAVPPELRA